MIENKDMPAMPVTDECGMPFNDIPAELSTIGLTKREMFAMHAMQAQITADDEVKPENVAKYAVEYADALLKELEK